MNRFTELLAVLESDIPNGLLTITDKRREVLVEALRAAGSSAEHFNVVLPITFERVADLISAFVDSGDPVSRDWCHRFVVMPEQVSTETKSKLVKTAPWYSQAAFWSDPDFMVRIEKEAASAADSKTFYLRPADIARGLQLLATFKDKSGEAVYAHHFVDILQDNIDASTADIFMQMVVYGEEVFA